MYTTGTWNEEGYKEKMRQLRSQKVESPNSVLNLCTPFDNNDAIYHTSYLNMPRPVMFLAHWIQNLSNKFETHVFYSLLPPIKSSKITILSPNTTTNQSRSANHAFLRESSRHAQSYFRVICQSHISLCPLSSLTCYYSANNPPIDAGLCCPLRFRRCSRP